MYYFLNIKICANAFDYEISESGLQISIQGVKSSKMVCHTVTFAKGQILPVLLLRLKNWTMFTSWKGCVNKESKSAIRLFISQKQKRSQPLLISKSRTCFSLQFELSLGTAKNMFNGIIELSLYLI